MDEKSGLEIAAGFRIILHSINQKSEGSNQAAKANFQVDMYTSKTMTVETSFSSTNLKVNNIIKLDKLYFDQSKYELCSESGDQLEKLYRTLRDNPKMKIQIDGHTDNAGDSRLNELVSQSRAKVIYTYLIRKNTTSAPLKHRGFGSTHPIAPNDSEENKSPTRRVDFIGLVD